MLLKRCYDKEIMDDFSVDDIRIEQALDELKLINKFLGGTKTSLSGLKYFIDENRTDEVKILDIGSGTSDIFLNSMGSLTGIKVYSVDRNKKICRLIKTRNSFVPINGNGLILPFKENSVSVIHASLFLHHFRENEIIEIIKSSMKIAWDGIIINDLRRSVWALIGIRILTLLFSRSAMVRNDAPISVKRGFIKKDITTILQRLNITNFILKRKWAFRWLIIIKKSQ